MSALQPVSVHTYKRIGLDVGLNVAAVLQELDSSEKQWLEVCGQIDKLDKFFPLSNLAMTKAREAQTAAIARGTRNLIMLTYIFLMHNVQSQISSVGYDKCPGGPSG